MNSPHPHMFDPIDVSIYLFYVVADHGPTNHVSERAISTSVFRKLGQLLVARRTGRVHRESGVRYAQEEYRY